MKNDRQKHILSLIAVKKIKTQEELAELLNADGYRVTQATVSRDIKSLSLIKKSDPDGNSYYAPPRTYNTNVKEHYRSVLKEGYLRADTAMNMLVIKTVSGMAMAVAAAIEEYRFPEIVGCIAGDDTIFCAVSSVEAANKLKELIAGLVDSK